jgi:hypothetical protein
MAGKLGNDGKTGVILVVIPALSALYFDSSEMTQSLILVSISL